MSEKKEKYYEAPEVEVEVKKILDAYPERFGYGIEQLKCLYKTGKNKFGPSQVSVRFVKEPLSFLTTKQAIVIVIDGWWNDNIHSDRVKGLLDGLLSITYDEGTLVKRDYDIKTYRELLSEDDMDYSRFERILPGEAKLTLTSPK